MSAVQSSIMEALKRATKRNARVALNQPVVVVALDRYPDEEQTTFVTAGLSEYLYTMWRGQKSGFELTLTVQDAEHVDWARKLSLVAAESIRLRETRERRPQVEYNGVYAPGYPPHFFFCQELTQTPEPVGQQKVGNKYVRWLPAIPISDTELRMYDRSVKELTKVLSQRNDLAEWPRQKAHMM